MILSPLRSYDGYIDLYTSHSSDVTSVVKQPLCCRSLPSINMSHDANIPSGLSDNFVSTIATISCRISTITYMQDVSRSDCLGTGTYYSQVQAYE